MLMTDIIVKKRDGLKLSAEEIKFFVDGYTAGDIPDYQMSALLMAILLLWPIKQLHIAAMPWDSPSSVSRIVPSAMH